MQYQRNSRFYPAAGMGRYTAIRERESDAHSHAPCGFESAPSHIVAPALAMVYSPAQEFDDLYDYDTGLCRGTVFMALDKPFMGGRCSS